MFNLFGLRKKTTVSKPIDAKFNPSVPVYSDLPSLTEPLKNNGSIVETVTPWTGGGLDFEYSIPWRSYIHTIEETYDTVYPSNPSPTQFTKTAFQDLNAVNLNDTNSGIVTTDISDEDMQNFSGAF